MKIIKNFKVLFLLTFVMGVFMTSCTKDNAVSNKLPEAQAIEQPGQPTGLFNETFSFAEMVAITENFNADHANFEDDKQLFIFLNSFDKLEESEQDVLTKNLPYKSLTSTIDEAYDGMDGLETEQAFENYISQYSDYLEIATDENREKEVVELHKSRHTASHFINNDRLIKVNDTFSKYIGDYLARSKNLSELKAIKTVDDLLSSSVNQEQVIEELQSVEKIWDDELEWEKVKNKSWCKNDRRVNLCVSNYIESNNSSQKAYRESSVVARRKGIPCIWYKYKTTITWNNFRAEYMFNQYTIWTASNISMSNTKSISRRNVIWYMTNNSPAIPALDWEHVKTNTTTTGMGGIWLNVDESF